MPTLSNSEFVDWVVTAVEHMGYGWSDYDVVDDVYGHVGAAAVLKASGVEVRDPDRVPFSMRFAAALLDGRRLTVTDRYGEGYSGTLTRSAVRSAILDRMARYCCEDYDVLDADSAMQVAALGEVTFG